MAAELEHVNGRASMFSVLETPWHREGTVLAAAPTFNEALALGRLDYEVVRIAAHTPTGPNGELQASKMVFCTMRTDTRRELGRVGPDYTPVQNAEAFEVLRPLVDSGVLTLETGGVLRDGADAWLLGRWDVAKFGPVVREIFADEVIPFSTILANHSGRRGVLLGNTPVRIVCANTLGMAEQNGISRWETIRHTGDANLRLIGAAEKMFKGIIERYEIIATQYRAMKGRILTAQEFEAAVLDVIAPDPSKLTSWNPEAKLAKVVLARNEWKRTTLTELWEKGRGHVGDHSAWEAYNGAVEGIDHDVQGLWPVRDGSYRTAALLDGKYGMLKNQTLDALVALSA